LHGLHDRGGTSCDVRISVFFYCSTVCVTEAELLAMSEFQGYVTVTVVDPTASDEVVNVAVPLLSSTVPRVVFPVVNVTGPEGTTVGEVIFAVKVTACPCVDGLGDEVSVAELVACCTVWLKTGDVLPELLPSPR